MPKISDAPLAARPDQMNASALWLATDHFGHVAAFAAAGRGPIPRTAPPTQSEIDIQVQLHRLLDFTEVLLSRNAERFRGLGQRGLFVFNWIEAQRAYEHVATPIAPITADNLPPALQTIAKSIVFHALSFDEARTIDLSRHFPCLPNQTALQ